MTRYLGAGGASAVAAAFFLTVGSSAAASAQAVPVPSPIAAPTAQPLAIAAASSTTTLSTPAVSVAASLPQPQAATAVASTSAASAVGSLWALIWANMAGAALDEELNCIATAVYFESRGEPFEGQLAVAEVVMNRARSGRYPSSYCAVVKQPAQFSFVRRGQFPRVNTESPAWSYAQAITRIAANRLADKLPDDVLWYHADYVAPVWGRRLSRVEKIGAHIFYRS